MRDKMKNNYLIILLIIHLVFTISCNNNSNNNSNSIESKIIAHTECKNSNKSRIETSNNDTITSIEYNYNQTNNELILKHTNTAFNCCVTELYSNTTTEGNLIVIKELEKSENCKCLCLYDINIKLTNIKKDKHIIQIDELYDDKTDIIKFEIDLNKSIAGRIDYIRKYYPWGINQ